MHDRGRDDSPGGKISLASSQRGKQFGLARHRRFPVGPVPVVRCVVHGGENRPSAPEVPVWRAPTGGELQTSATSAARRPRVVARGATGDAFAFYAGDIRVEGPHPLCSRRGNLGNGLTRTAMYSYCIEQLRGTAGAGQVRVRAETVRWVFTMPGSGDWIMFGKRLSRGAVTLETTARGNHCLPHALLCVNRCGNLTSTSTDATR